MQYIQLCTIFHLYEKLNVPHVSLSIDHTYIFLEDVCTKINNIILYLCMSVLLYASMHVTMILYDCIFYSAW